LTRPIVALYGEIEMDGEDSQDVIHTGVPGLDVDAVRTACRNDTHSPAQP